MTVELAGKMSDDDDNDENGNNENDNNDPMQVEEEAVGVVTDADYQEMLAETIRLNPVINNTPDSPSPRRSQRGGTPK